MLRNKQLTLRCRRNPIPCILFSLPPQSLSPLSNVSVSPYNAKCYHNAGVHLSPYMLQNCTKVESDY